MHLRQEEIFSMRRSDSDILQERYAMQTQIEKLKTQLACQPKEFKPGQSEVAHHCSLRVTLTYFRTIICRLLELE